MVNETAVTREQVRAARGWLYWSQSDLAARSGVAQRTIALYEAGRTVPHDDTLRKIRAALEDAGARFQFVGMRARGMSIVFPDELPSPSEDAGARVDTRRD